MPNMDKIDQALTFVTDHPDKHDQKKWMCETGGCLAGWGAVLNDWVVVYDNFMVKSENYDQAKKLYDDYRAATFIRWGDPNPNWDEINKRENEFDLTKVALGITHVRQVAMELFGIDHGTASILFAATNTVDKLQLMAKDIANGEILFQAWKESGSAMNPIWEQVEKS